MAIVPISYTSQWRESFGISDHNKFTTVNWQHRYSTGVVIKLHAHYRVNIFPEVNQFWIDGYYYYSKLLAKLISNIIILYHYRYYFCNNLQRPKIYQNYVSTPYMDTISKWVNPISNINTLESIFKVPRHTNVQDYNDMMWSHIRRSQH